MLHVKYQNQDGFSGIWDDIVDTANKVGGKIVDVAKDVPGALNTAAKATCGVLQNNATQAGASMATKVPEPITQGTARAVQLGSKLCSTAYPSKSTPSATSGKGGGSVWGKTFQWTDKLQRAKERAAFQRFVAALPAGAVQWQTPIGKWVVAVPKKFLKSSGLAGTLSVPAASGPASYVRGTGFLPPGLNRSLFRSNSDQYYSVVTADSPYTATWGVGAFEIVGQADEAIPGLQQVTADEGEKLVKPVWKKWWFWTAIGGGVAAAGAGTYLALRNR